jgi:glycosyltransferase involved in cell wall biosynthesis
MVFGPQGAPRQYAGARVFSAPGLPLPFYPELRALMPPPRFERLLARFRPDVVHVADPVLLGAAGIHWARRLGVPVISSYHTNLSTYCAYFHLAPFGAPLQRYRRFLHSQCATTLCPSPSTAARLRDQGFERVGVWSRGVNAELFMPERRSAAWRARMAGDPARPIVLYAGRLSHEKNLNALVAAFTTLPANAAHLVLVGDGPARGELERALAGQSATFTGYLSGAALAEAYASSDVFAFPSTTETFGQVVLEAMASGLPVVAYDAEGVCDQVAHGETGLLAPLGDTGIFAAHLAALLEATERRAALGACALERARERRWESVMDGLLDVYRCTIAGVPQPMAA